MTMVEIESSMRPIPLAAMLTENEEILRDKKKR